jgi:hypothetical protein
MRPATKLNGTASPVLINLALAGYVGVELAVIVYIIVHVIKHP